MRITFENEQTVQVEDSAFTALEGRVITDIELGTADSSDAIRIQTNDGETYIMMHYQDCCEQVWLEDITGDLEDLVGAYVSLAEVVSEYDESGNYESATWTFYKIRTMNGDVTLRWCGASNGYYSESVGFYRIK